MLGDLEFVGQRKRSRLETADTYRTLRPFEPNLDHVVGNPRKWLMWERLVIVATAALALFMATR
jgi:hypothetical protein